MTIKRRHYATHGSRRLSWYSQFPAETVGLSVQETKIVLNDVVQVRILEATGPAEVIVFDFGFSHGTFFAHCCQGGGTVWTSGAARRMKGGQCRHFFHTPINSPHKAFLRIREGIATRMVFVELHTWTMRDRVENLKVRCLSRMQPQIISRNGTLLSLLGDTPWEWAVSYRQVRISPEATFVSQSCPREGLIYITEGSGTLTGDDSECSVFPGDYFKVSPGQVHRITADSEGLNCIIIHSPGNEPWEGFFPDT